MVGITVGSETRAERGGIACGSSPLARVAGSTEEIAEDADRIPDIHPTVLVRVTALEVRLREADRPLDEVGTHACALDNDDGRHGNLRISEAAMKANGAAARDTRLC